jgi:hypothetical protein
LCLSGSYSRLLQGQKLPTGLRGGSYSRLLQGQKVPTGLRVLSVRFARSRPESRPAAFGHIAPIPVAMAAISAPQKRTLQK